ncbi:ABC transporter ATP-binding protein [Lacticaseibacillus baoqingensis]|uniref:ABC transporter ATP-binding protein n=1 Tax=Lacticaseibacillus baoqingensis TaxID=2486013 RepID=A0ABW4E6C9_9LACO|nr:ABC transporter ATP-binding protein [Lacticaseibacillus baoqingensis]
MTDLIEFAHVTKTYHGDAVVADLNLTVHAGELFVLVGESGSGKTTTLKMINRLIEPSAGQIFFNGQPVTDYPIRKLRWHIGYVLQQIALFPTMTVGQNVALIPEMRHWPKSQVQKRVNELLDAVGLPAADYRERMPKALSGGEQQRVGILRAFAGKPPVVLMDEPFSALDPLSRNQLQELVLRLHQELGLTIIFVTHDMNEALRLGQRIGIMREGRLLQVATPTQIAEAPATGWVADFFSGAKRVLLDTPLAELAAYGTPVQGSGVSAQLPLRNVLTQITQTQYVTVAAKQGTFKLDAQAVLQFLADKA